MREDMADQRRLAGAEKAGDDRDGDFGEHRNPILRHGMQRRRARDHALAKRDRPLAPGHDPVVGEGEAPRGRQDVVEIGFEAEIANDVGPLAARGEGDGAGPLAHGKAFDRAQANPGLALGGDSRAQRVEQSLAEASFARLAGDADESVASLSSLAAVTGATARRSGTDARRRAVAEKSESEKECSSKALLDRPTGDRSDENAHGRSPGSRAYRRRRLPGSDETQWRSAPARR